MIDLRYSACYPRTDGRLDRSFVASHFSISLGSFSGYDKACSLDFDVPLVARFP